MDREDKIRIFADMFSVITGIYFIYLKHTLIGSFFLACGILTLSYRFIYKGV